MSVELLVALAALLSWVVVGVVMFDFVEYKAVPGKSQKERNIHRNLSNQNNPTFPLFCLDVQQIITDPVQAVHDAVDEVSILLNKFQGSEGSGKGFHVWPRTPLLTASSASYPQNVLLI